MHRGKEICNELKAVRRSIAEENGIDLEIPECPHNGPCPGTCPRCEAEVRYLENALASRIRMGKVATVAGITLGLSLCANAQSEVSVIEIGTPVGSAHQVVSNGVLKGTVIDLKTNEPLPFVKVALMQGDTLVLGGTTDFDGLYTLKPIPAGVYTLVVSSVGNQRVERQGIRVLPTGFTICDIALDPDTSGFSYGVTEIGTGDDNSKIVFSAFTYDHAPTATSPKKYNKVDYVALDTELGNFGSDEFKIGGNLGRPIDPKEISDTIYIVAELQPYNPGTPTYVYPEAAATEAEKDIVKDTVKIVINKSIAFINAKGDREILTADKYKTDIDFTKPIEAGTYYVGSSYWDTSTNVVIKGNVTLISNGNSLGVNTLTDQTDNATLKIFGEAINTTTEREYNTANPYIYVQGDNGDGISNFNQIDFYTGDIHVNTNKANCGAFENVKNINVFGGYLDARNTSSGYAINLKEGGKFTVDGGAAFAAAAGESEVQRKRFFRFPSVRSPERRPLRAPAESLLSGSVWGWYIPPHGRWIIMKGSVSVLEKT